MKPLGPPTELNRDQFLERFARAQWLGWILELGCIVMSLALLVMIDWPSVGQDPFYSSIVLLLVPMQMVPSLVHVLAIKKKSIDQLSQSARFGVFDKFELHKVVNDVLRDLNIPQHRVKVFITASKDVNAAAVGIGLSRLLPTLRGIYLNRKTLHLVTPAELRCWVGHELGHLFPYAMRMDQAVLLRLLAGSMLALFVYQQCGLFGGLGIMAAVASAYGFLFVTSIPRSQYSQVVEYLCDDFGAQAAGVNVAIVDMIRTGAAHEAEFELGCHIIELGRQGKTVSEQEAFRIYESVLGYEPEDIESTKKRIQQAIQQKNANRSIFSIREIFDFLWNDPDSHSDEAERRDELLANRKALQQMPALDWKSIARWNDHDSITDEQVEQLVMALEKSPHMLLFRTMEEVQAGEELSHPSFRNRILYLWRNRAAIEEARRRGTRDRIGW